MPDRTEGSSRLSKLVLWATFFLICFGLGYSTLNRYDPRQLLPDAGTYAKLAQDGPASISSPFRFRVLIPVLAHSVATLAKGRIGTWDPMLFGFLVVNSAFAATTAFLISVIGESLLADSAAALLASTLYLLNFAVSNAHLAALVDSGEALFLMAVVVSMFYQRWLLLPLIGVLGALTKESFIPFSILMAVTWCLVSPDAAHRRRHGIWIVAMIATECATVITLQSTIEGHLAWPWGFAADLNSHSNYFANFGRSLLDRSSWYILIWLLPLGLIRIRSFPREWVASAAVASLCALILNAYHSTVGGGGGGVGRYVFDIAGPLLSLSASAFLARNRNLI
jgi:hypothetical protein